MDPIADMLVIIKNGYLANKEQVSMPYSKFRFQVAKVISKAGFVGNVSKSENSLVVDLIYKDDKKPRITEIKKVSKLGLRTYIKSKNIKLIKGGRGTSIISTSAGVMTGVEAKKKNLGGEIICQIW
jgi:small subunit ribosomal protein S8